MSDEQQHRRWEDAQRQIAAETAIAVAQAMTPFRLTLERLDRSLDEVRATLYGRPDLRQAGVLDRLDQFEKKIGAIDSKLDTVLDEGRDRTNQILGARKAAYVLAAAIGVIGGPPAIAGLLKLFGISL